MRKVNSRFHIEDERLVKTSNGQAVPPEEPVYILRGRDHLALKALEKYRELAVADGCNEQFLQEHDTTAEEFRHFATQYYDRMKQPGVTRGK